ncbi:MAG: glycosyltransferase family protein [Candidatus Omnitrophica bacterium]|nr:glycosyltransferase family protein [Candidatus Omnitrophota bacterium]
MNKKRIAIIQARMGSTRLPGKILKDIKGRSMLWHVVDRVDYSNLIDKIVIATTEDKEDDKIENFCKTNNVYFYRGNQEDVLDRYYQTAKNYQADLIIRITSDCPLIDPCIIDKAITHYLDNEEKADYVSNTLERTYPRGMDVEVFPFRALEIAWQKAKEEYQREHVTPYIYENPDTFNLSCIKNENDLSYLRLTVDEEKDLELVREIYKKLYQKYNIFYLKDILGLFKKYPELELINKEVKQKNIKQ